MKRVALLVGLMIPLWAAPASRAASFSAPAHLPDPPAYAGNPGAGSEGPALDGERVLWMEQRGFGAALVAATAQGETRDFLTLSPLRTAGLFFEHLSAVAGSGRAFIERVAGTCPGSGNTCTGQERTVGEDLAEVQLDDGTVTALDGCLGDASCGPRCTPSIDGEFALDLVGGILAVTDPCVRGAGIRDLADAQTRRFPSSEVIAAAGRFAVLAHYGDEHADSINEIDWHSGKRVRALPIASWLGDEPRQVSVAASGEVAYVDVPGIRVLTPNRAGSVVVPVKAIDPYANWQEDQVRVGGDLIAARRITRDADGDFNTFTISRLDGTQRRRIDGQRIGGGWAFDGSRLAWATQPCSQIVIQVWDLNDAAPRPAPDDCGTAVYGGGVTLPFRRGALAVALECPELPSQGCATELHADIAPVGRSRRVAETYGQSVRMPAGSRRTVALRVLHHDRLRGKRGLRATLEVTSLHGDQRSVRRLPVRPASEVVESPLTVVRAEEWGR